MNPRDSISNSQPVLVSGYYGFRNLGDEAILEAIIQWFDSRDDVHPVVLSANPKGTFDSYGVDAINRTSLVDILRRIPGTPVLLQGGGGLLQDATSTRSLVYYLGILLMGFVTGRKVIVFGQGIGPLEGEFSALWVGEFLSQCQLVCVRDFKSYSFCQSRLPVDANLKLMSDPALLLEPAEAEEVEDIFLQENFDLVGRPLIAFCVKGSLRDKIQITALARTIDLTVRATGGGVVLIPFHHPSDLEYATTVRSLVEDRESVEILNGEYKPREVLGIIGKCDLVVGMRLHSLIFAANRRIPFVAVSYDPKIDEFAGEFDFKPAVHVPLVGPETLSEAIEDAWESRGKMRTKVTETSKRLQERAKSGFDVLGDYLDSLELKRMKIAGSVRRMAVKNSKAKKKRQFD